jgi:dTDP-4-amino-4,6-dideoxygalactose transaminase
MNVPLLDLKQQHRQLRQEIEQAIGEVVDAGAFCGGKFVEQFEAKFAAFCGTDYAVGVGSGTEALWMTLLGLGIGPGDTVITVPNTFIATAEAISMTGATPVFIDVAPLTHNMDPRLLEAAITNETRAILPVHLYGHPADMDPILRIARAHGLPVVEDACQAHGAFHGERRAGALGTAGCFSFYPSKNLGAFGEAGAVVTSDRQLCERLRMLRNHGQSDRDLHSMIGWNGRMDGIQAAVLTTKLKHLPDFIEGRRRCASRYNAALGTSAGLVCPAEAAYARHVYHVYAIRTPNRPALIEQLKAADIDSRVHYPVPIHLQTAYQGLGYRTGDFPITEQLAREVLSLPIYPEMPPDHLQHVTTIVKQHATANGATQGINTDD